MPDRCGGALATVDGRSLRRRAPGGVWSTIATTEFDLACCVAVGDVIWRGPPLRAQEVRTFNYAAWMSQLRKSSPNSQPQKFALCFQSLPA